MSYIDAEVFAATSAMDKHRRDAEGEAGSPSHSASVAMRSPSLHATNEMLAHGFLTILTSHRYRP
jgi:hypothetical protein